MAAVGDYDTILSDDDGDFGTFLGSLHSAPATAPGVTLIDASAGPEGAAGRAAALAAPGVTSVAVSAEPGALGILAVVTSRRSRRRRGGGGGPRRTSGEGGQLVG